MPANFQDLVALMARLRSPEGCPWDREQSYSTLAPMLLEEAYEAFEAVEEAREGRSANLCEELGDLLFQIVFYAQVASERGEFTIDDVTDRIHEKMVRRHPHVFGDVTVRDNEELLRNWEALKAEEKRAAGKEKGEADASLLDGVSSKAPALMEAHQLATKAARKLTNRKFRRRFRHIERGLRSRGREPGQATLEEMEELWQEAKGGE